MLATKRFNWTPLKITLSAALVTLLFGCELKNVRSEKSTPPLTPTPVKTEPTTSSNTTNNANPVLMTNQGSNKKLGLILGPGASLTYAHIGVLEELQKNKIPVEAIVGIEFAALPAALFANNGQSYDVEWQMMKLRDKEMNSFNLVETMELKSYFDSSFKNKSSDQSKIKFGCPAFNFAKKKLFMMSKGNYDQLLAYCMAYPPLFKSYKQNISGIADLKAAADFLRANGATYIVYVNVLESYTQDDPAWQTVRLALYQQTQNVDFVLNVSIKDIKLNNFNEKRGLVELGIQSTKANINHITEALGL